MAEKLMDIRELAKEHAREVCKNPETWTNYLDTAAKLYRYPFIDTFLIHAQRPEATACASMPEWNKIMNRWVNRGAKGIALLDDSGNRLKLRYVFDIKDTHPVKGAKPIHLWKMSLKKEKALINHLNKTYDLKVTDKDRMPTVLRELARTLTAENIGQAMYDLNKNKDKSYLSTMEEVTLLKHFTKLIEESITYILMKRCGFHPIEHMDMDNFEMIRMFDDINVLPYLGEAVHNITEPVLRDIGRTINEIDRQEQLKNNKIDGQIEFKLDGNDVIFEVNKDNQSNKETDKESPYGKQQEYRIHEERRLHVPESDTQREEKRREQEDKSRTKEREPQRLRSTPSDRQAPVREAIATTMILPILPEIKKQQEIIEESMKNRTKTITQKQVTPQKQRPSLTERLKEKQALSDRLNNKKALKPKIRRQNEATL